jgi:hypothetical protein
LVNIWVKANLVVNNVDVVKVVEFGFWVLGILMERERERMLLGLFRFELLGMTLYFFLRSGKIERQTDHRFTWMGTLIFLFLFLRLNRGINKIL